MSKRFPNDLEDPEFADHEEPLEAFLKRMDDLDDYLVVSTNTIQGDDFHRLLKLAKRHVRHMKKLT